jgi:hypothetical protein
MERFMNNKQIVQAVNRLMILAMTKEVSDKGGLQVAYMGQFGSIWVTTCCLNDSSNIITIKIDDDLSVSVTNAILRIKNELSGKIKPNLDYLPF